MKNFHVFVRGSFPADGISFERMFEATASCGKDAVALIEELYDFSDVFVSSITVAEAKEAD